MYKRRSVDSKVYTRKYYLTDCTGYKEFQKSYGEELEPRFRELIKYFTVKPGTRILDIGCGRGEMVLYSACHGAKVVGIDYSEKAIELASMMKSKKEKSIKDNMSFYLMNAKKLEFKNSYFDMVILTDVVEHLYNEELEIVFQELKRVLKKDGLLVVHTAPNKLFFDIGYKFYSYPLSTVLVYLWNILTGKHYPNIANPKNLRTDSHAVMHVNEPTYLYLKKNFDKYKFLGNIVSSNITAKKPIFGIKDIIFNLLVFLDPFSKYYPLNILFGSDFVAVLKNQK